MAYKELVKNFNKVRDYLRDFYVYGFKSRDEFTKKSARSYDDERRRLESWLGEYMQFRQTADGKNIFLSIDSRVTSHNPLYKAWKTKSFTDGDITLHFLLMDILSETQPFSLSQITEKMDNYLSGFSNNRVFDTSTIRKKLKEYITEGIVLSKKDGKTLYYRKAAPIPNLDVNALHYFSEVAPCGVIGSFILDETNNSKSNFAFKHHYITGTMDSGIMYTLLNAIHDKRSITLTTVNRRKNRISEKQVVPLKIMISVQNGRQYLMASSPSLRRITSYRLDNIVAVKPEEVHERFDEYREKLDGMKPHIWGVSTSSRNGNRMEHIEFTIQYTAEELHIPGRLEREKRCGTVVQLDETHSRFIADVYDASELIPWIRTFICRITDITISNKNLENRFKEDIRTMYAMYGLEEGDNHVIQ